MTEKNNASNKRRERAIQRLGVNDPHCVICMEGNPFCLERHHVAGQAYANDIVILCRTCHRKMSEKQEDHPKAIQTPPERLEEIAHFHLGLAELLRVLGAAQRDYALEAIAMLHQQHSKGAIKP